jgi:hypothetical protein
MPPPPPLPGPAEGREEEGTKPALLLLPSWLPALRSACGWMSVMVVGAAACWPPGWAGVGCWWWWKEGGGVYDGLLVQFRL